MTSYSSIRGYLTGIPEMRGLDASAAYMVNERSESTEQPVESELVSYLDENGREYRYLWQKSETSADSNSVLIYFHGAGGDETEGFGGFYSPDTFHRLRVAALTRGWHYLSVRDYEFKQLLEHVRSLYEPKSIYLVGQSQGGKELLKFIESNQNGVDGIVLACPAFSMTEMNLEKLAELRIPTVLMAGEAEPQIGPYSRQLAYFLNQYGVPLLFIEYPNGGHCQPFLEADWTKVLDFFRP